MPNRLKMDITVYDCLIHLAVWTVLGFVTFGIALLFYPYYLCRFLINHIYFVDAAGVTTGRMQVDFSFGEILLHSLGWILLIFVTLGLAYFLNVYMVWRYLFNKSVVVKY